MKLHKSFHNLVNFFNSADTRLTFSYLQFITIAQNVHAKWAANNFILYVMDCEKSLVVMKREVQNYDFDLFVQLRSCRNTSCTVYYNFSGEFAYLLQSLSVTTFLDFSQHVFYKRISSNVQFGKAENLFRIMKSRTTGYNMRAFLLLA